MPKVRLLAPWRQYAAGAEADVSDEEFNELRNDGKASSIDDEKAAEERAREGAYSERTGREDVAGAQPAPPPVEPTPPPAEPLAPPEEPLKE